MSATTDALSRVFDDPAFLSAVHGQSYKPSSLYTQLLTNMLASYIPNTPAQQTRSGRISRPPVASLDHPLLQTLVGTDPDQMTTKATRDELARNDSAQPWCMNAGVYPEAHAPKLIDGPGSKRSLSVMEEDEGSNLSVGDGTPQSNECGDEGDVDQKRRILPPYPLPPSGRNSRKSMPRDELLARRRARNRVAGELTDC